MARAPSFSCVCDDTQLRILNLLTEQPSSALRIQEVLGKSRTRISKSLAAMAKAAMVVSHRQGNAKLYSLPPKPNKELKANLECLHNIWLSDRTFRVERKRLRDRESPPAAVPAKNQRSPKRSRSGQSGPSAFQSPRHP